ncbi:uncharacterized protein LOC124353666 [Homalodisca vitripennis]|uniref:uncharacterized protein LOC124353666 n=1 Tax=Homalodisca vitripennis TaxID=197043 RepID=UPI001EEC257A|nr:uncharacterized protein LOC124353666 [Homalodisca vitripennis]XP_046659571.1 uncharacterized protein LOC124353666 [Homalodisca vitripennis]
MSIRTTVVVTLFIIIGANADKTSITISNAALVSDNGNNCVQDGAINRCTVRRGEITTFQGVLNIDGGKYTLLGVDPILITLEWTKKELGKVVRRTRLCQKVGGDVQIEGGCGVTIMAGGHYRLVPFPVKIPELEQTVRTYFRALATARWTDGSISAEKEIGRCEVIIE